MKIKLNSLMGKILIPIIIIMILMGGAIYFRSSNVGRRALFDLADENERDLVGVYNEIFSNYARNLSCVEGDKIQEVKNELRHGVESAYSILSRYKKQVDENILSEEEAKKEAFNAIRGIRFGHNNYIFIQNTENIMLLHGTDPSLENRDLTDLKDEDGKYFIQEMSQISKENGEGIVEYKWPKPGGEVPYPKLSYFKYFEQWDYIVGSGRYIDEVNKEVEQQEKNILEELRVTLYEAGFKNYAYAFNKNGDIVMHPEKNMMGKKLRDVDTGEDIGRKMVEKKEGILEYNYTKDGQGSYKKRAYITYNDTLDWTIVVGVYEDHILEEVKTLNKNVLFTTILFLIVGLTILTFIIIKVIERIDEIILDISTGTEDLKDASIQIANGGQSLAETTTEQASSIREISSNLEETTSIINTTTDNVKEASNLSFTAKNSAQTGNRQMEKMLEAMEEIKDSSDEIDKIIKTIDDIAFKTNILALNAAVEAARAGEAGSGFAVVAEEVRNLAAQSTKAAQNTAEMIEKSVSRSKNGMEIAQKVDKSLTEIKKQNEQVSEIMEEITIASEEQSKGIEEINVAISQMENVTENISATSEESAATSEELSAQIENMNEIAKRLKRLVTGEKEEK